MTEGIAELPTNLVGQYLISLIKNGERKINLGKATEKTGLGRKTVSRIFRDFYSYALNENKRSCVVSTCIHPDTIVKDILTLPISRDGVVSPLESED